MYEAMIGAGAQILGGVFNNMWADTRTAEDRYMNYKYNELTAERADARTRQLYKDLYSPQALLNQYHAAGLSPSLMFGGTPGQGGLSGAKGGGPAGPQTPYMPISILEAAQAANIAAMTKKTEAETKNIEAETANKELMNAWQQFMNNEKQIEWNIINSSWEDSKTGETTSLFEMAGRALTYGDFLDDIRHKRETGELDPTILKETATEVGQRTLRAIYLAASTMATDISRLNYEFTDNTFKTSLINALNSIKNEKGNDIAHLNAEATVAQLEQQIETANLTKQQKESWNNILQRLKKSDSIWADIVVVATMILGNVANNAGVKLNLN